ncbi:hypothetical protein LIER_30182 [Lithospermum erythrorhizon]|uniref:Uncharacterized protein n=1 Tax=Lithospermum erythrorhizon TaxID=34254 RepID=A0AAV3RNZ5_LITER
MDGLQPKKEQEAPKAAQPHYPNKEIEVIEALKGLTLPLTQEENVASTILKGFVTPVQEPKIELRTVNPKAYDFLVKVGYDPTKDAAMGKSTPEVKTHGLNETQEKMQRKGYSIKISTSGLEYTLKPPLEEVANILDKYPDKSVYRYIYEQSFWNRCRPPKTKENKVNFQILKAEFMYEVIPQRERTLEEKLDLVMHRYIYEQNLWENDGKPDPRCKSEVARILNKHPDKWVYWNICEQTLWNECRMPKSKRTSKVVCLNHLLFNKTMDVITQQHSNDLERRRNEKRPRYGRPSRHYHL